jgi:hypothetical protein
VCHVVSKAFSDIQEYWSRRHFIVEIQGFFLSGVGLTSPGTAATSDLLYSPR